MADDIQMADNRGKQNDWVQITSTDGFSFIVQRDVAMRSGTLKNMLSTENNFAEAVSGKCSINERATVVEKVLEYLAYKKQYEGAGPREEIPDFQERIAPELALELLMAAHYLEA